MDAVLTRPTGGRFRRVTVLMLTLTSFLILGAVLGRPHYGAPGAAGIVTEKLAPASVSEWIAVLVAAESSTIAECLILALSRLTVCPTVIASGVVAYRALALGWCLSLAASASSPVLWLRLAGYALATFILLFFASESPDEREIIPWIFGFLTMAAAVMAAEILPLLAG